MRQLQQDNLQFSMQDSGKPQFEDIGAYEYKNIAQTKIKDAPIRRSKPDANFNQQKQVNKRKPKLNRYSKAQSQQVNQWNIIKKAADLKSIFQNISNQKQELTYQSLLRAMNQFCAKQFDQALIYNMIALVNKQVNKTMTQPSEQKNGSSQYTSRQSFPESKTQPNQIPALQKHLQLSFSFTDFKEFYQKLMI